jgi:hypothetical protein
MTEARLQTDIIKRVLKPAYDSGRIRYTAITNNVPVSGKRGMINQVQFGRLGLQKGFPDMMVLITGPVIEFWEVKLPGAYLTPEQEDWEMWLMEAGFNHRVIRSVEDAMEAVRLLDVSTTKQTLSAIAGMP